MNWFAFLIGAGASMAIWRIVQGQKKREDLQWAIAGLWILAGSWIGARLAFFIWQPGTIAEYGWNALGLSEGGMVWPGAVLGAWITLFILAFAKHQNWLEVADRLLVMLPPLVIMSWLAGWFSGSGYGPVMPSAWWVPMTMDDSFQIMPRFPLQWIAATSLFLIFYLTEQRFPKNKIGARAGIIWTIFSVHTLIFSFLRADHRPEFAGIYWDIWFLFLCLLWAIIFLWIVLFQKSKAKKVEG